MPSISYFPSPDSPVPVSLTPHPAGVALCVPQASGPCLLHQHTEKLPYPPGSQGECQGKSSDHRPPMTASGESPKGCGSLQTHPKGQDAAGWAPPRLSPPPQDCVKKLVSPCPVDLPGSQQPQHLVSLPSDTVSRLGSAFEGWKGK